MTLSKKKCFALALLLLSNSLLADYRIKKTRVLRNVNIGRILTHSGEVYLDEVRVNSKAAIFTGARITTKEGTVQIAFGRETLITLAGHSELEIHRLKRLPGSKIVSIVALLNEGKIQGMALMNGQDSQVPISILSPRGELIMRGGRFSAEVSYNEKNTSQVKFLSLDRTAELAIFRPQEIVYNQFFDRDDEADTGELGIGLISDESVPFPERERRTVKLERMQLAQMESSGDQESLFIISLNESEAIKEYSARLPVRVYRTEEKTKPLLSPISATRFKRQETLNLVQTLDQVVISNFSTATLVLDL